MDIRKGLRDNSLVYFADDGHAFIKNKKVGNVTYLRCRMSCGVTITYIEIINTILSQNGTHPHEPDLSKPFENCSSNH